MIYKNTVRAKFIDRPNRFIAHVEIDGQIETVHVKNTGRCKELLLPGSTVILEDFRTQSTTRKTKFDLIAVYKTYSENKPPLLINMDSQAPNKVVAEWLEKKSFDLVHPEFTYGDSRIDFYMEKSGEKFLTEIKGCTLEINGIGFFPDAPTERGVKHLKELTAAQKKGFICSVGFVIQMEGISEVRPNIQTHPEFGIALDEAKKAGVKIIFYECKVEENSLEIIGEHVK